MNTWIKHVSETDTLHLSFFSNYVISMGNIISYSNQYQLQDCNEGWTIYWNVITIGIQPLAILWSNGAQYLFRAKCVYYFELNIVPQRCPGLQNNDVNLSLWYCKSYLTSNPFSPGCNQLPYWWICHFFSLLND